MAGSLIRLVMHVGEGRWAPTSVRVESVIVTDTSGIVLTWFEHAAWIVGGRAIGTDEIR